MKPGAEANSTRAGVADVAAPLFVRRAFRAVIATLLCGAIYLIAVRREAILIDLANFSAWCF